VDVLARAFNMDKADFLGHVTVIEGFASSGLEAVLIDKDFYMVYDNLLKMETIRNPKGLYWNYFYHVWQTLSVSRFANAVAFVSGEVAPVTQVIIDPTIASLKAGNSMQFNVFVRSNDGLDHDVVWSVEGRDDTVVLSGTTIDAEGKITLSSNQVGELKVSATVSYEDSQEIPVTQTVVGESLLSVIPTL